MKIKNNLKIWRAKKDVTQQRLSEIIEISRQTVNSIEKGKFVPSVFIALKMAHFFETNVEDIFFLAEYEDSKQE